MTTPGRVAQSSPRGEAYPVEVEGPLEAVQDVGPGQQGLAVEIEEPDRGGLPGHRRIPGERG